MNLPNARYLTYIFAHVALFVIFFWFGLLKVLGLSPATPLVDALRDVTITWWPIDSFIIFLGWVEMLTGVLFLFTRTQKIAGLILIPHMITTIMPLVLVPHVAWYSFGVPTLEGQYIIKNLVIMALAASVVIGYRKTKPCK
jgi:uncharacterized membrane protein YkgB